MTLTSSFAGTLALAAALLVPAAGAHAAEPGLPAVSASGLPLFSNDMLAPEFWIRRAPAPDAVLLGPDRLAAQRAAAYAPGGGFLDLRTLPATVTREQVAAWLKEAERTPVKLAVDKQGMPVTAEVLRELRRNTAADAIAPAVRLRPALSVRRAPMRALPTDQPFFAATDQREYESLTAGTPVPGEPVLVVHHSSDREWVLVMTSQGATWVRSAHVAEGTAEEVFGYAATPPGRVVTGDHVRTVFTPEAPGVSEIDLDMGIALPSVDLAPGEAVNGAGSHASWVVRLPVRQPDGALAFRNTLLRRTADTAPGYLPLTRANILRQAFKFLGERYGWGHQFNARDCSGFTSAVYRSMGVLLQHSSASQGTSTALKHRLFTASDSHAARVQALKEAQVGDLVVVPGHVMMIVGHVDGEPYVIQDVPYAVFKDPSTGAMRKTKLNQVAVTPLLPLFADDTTLYVDAMTSLVQVTRQ